MTEFSFKGQRIHAGSYGADYLPNFRRAVERHAPPGTRAMLEWGSGLTSLVLLEYGARWGVELFLTLDNNAEWQRAVFAGRETPPWLRAACLDPQGPSQSQSDPGLHYSAFPLGFGRRFDLVFIDGRRRVECGLTAALLCHEGTRVLLHDWRRARYTALLGLFEVVEEDAQFRVLRLRPELAAGMAEGFSRVRAALAAAAEMIA